MFALKGIEEYDRWVRQQMDQGTGETGQDAVMEMRDVYYGNIRGLCLNVRPGECVVL